MIDYLDEPWMLLQLIVGKHVKPSGPFSLTKTLKELGLSASQIQQVADESNKAWSISLKAADIENINVNEMIDLIQRKQRE